MTLQLRRKNERSELKAAAEESVADSTMKDNPGSIETVTENVEIRCYVERRKREDELLGGDLNAVMLEQDSKVIVPAVSAFADLLQTVLHQRGYSEVDVLGAKGMLQIKNWKPMTLDAITDHPWAKVGDILGRLSGLTTLKITLCNSSGKYAIMDDIKQKLLSFLLKNSKHMLQDSGCPIKQTTLEDISSDSFKECKEISDDIQSRFNNWYQIQTSSFKKSQTHDINPSIVNGFSLKHFKNEDAENFLLNSNEGGQSLNGSKPGKSREYILRNRSYDRLLMSHNPSNQQKLTKKHLKYGTALNTNTSMQQVHRHINTQGFPNQWQHGQLHMVYKPTNNKMHSASTPNWNISPRSGRKTIEIIGSLHQTNQTNDNTKWLDGESNLKVPQNLEAEEEAVPVLPNKNAIYVIKPLPVSSPCLESMEVVLDGIEEDELLECDHPENPEPKDLTRIVSSSTPKKDKMSEQRYDRFNSSLADHDEPMNLNLKASSETSLNNRIYKENPFTSIGMEGSEHSQKEKVHDDDDSYSDNSSFDNDSSSEPSTPKFSTQFPPSGPFGFLPQFQILQQHQQQHAASRLLAMTNTFNFMNQMPSVYNPTQPLSQVPFNDYSGIEGSDSEHRKRSRIFIDPMTETPKLEEWFLLDSHPSSAVIEQYTAELNESSYRKRFPKLEPKNVQLWFKNHRAKIKRQQFECTTDKSKPDVPTKQ